MSERKKKRIVSLLLTACMIVSNLFLYMPQMALEAEAGSAQSSIKYEEKFQTEGTILAGWDENFSDVTKNIETEEDNKFLKITYANSNTISWVPQYMFGSSSGDQECKKAELTYKVKVETNTGSIFLPSFCGNSGRGEKIGQLAINGGKLKKINAQNGWDTLSPEQIFQNNTWYEVRQVVDITAGTYDLYIDNTEILQKELLVDHKVSIKGITFGCYKNESYVFCLDNIKVVEEKEQSRQGLPFEENFNACTEMPFGWSENGDYATKAIVAEEENKVLKIDFSSDQTTSWVTDYLFYKDGASDTSEKAALTYRFKFATNGSVIFLPSFRNKDENRLKIGQLSIHGKQLKKINAQGSWETVAGVQELQENTWYDFKQIVDITEGIYNLYIGDTLVLNDETIVDNKVSIGGITFGCYKNAAYSFYLDDIKAEHYTGSLKDENGSGKIYKQDFETITSDAFKSSWIKNANRTETTESIEMIEDGTSGKVLKLKHVPADVSLRMDHTFGTQTYQKAVLKYRAKVEKKNGTITLPGFVTSQGLIGQMAIQEGQVKKYTPSWNAIDYSFETGKWYEFEQIIDVEKGVFDFYIDGKAVVIQEQIHEAKAVLSGLSFSIYKTTDNTFYLDDICVEAYVQGTAVTFEKQEYEAYAGGEPIELKLSFTPSNASFRNAQYQSSDATVATVDADGKVCGLKEGEATITATPYDTSLQPVTTKVKVKKLTVSSFTVNPATVILAEGGHTKLTVNATPEAVLTQGIHYVSEDPTIATVDEWGQIMAVSEGTTTVTVSSALFPEYQSSVSVTVEKAQIQKTIYVSPDGTGDGTSKSTPCSLLTAMSQVAAIDKTTMTGDIVVELAEGYYKQNSTLKLGKDHGGNNEHYVIYRAAENAEVTIGGAEKVTAPFSKVEGTDYYVAQLEEGIDTRQLYVDNIRATRARSAGELKNASLLMDEAGTCIGFTCENTELLDIPEANRAELELVFFVMWSNSRCGVSQIVDAGNGKVNLIMDQPGFGYTYNKGNTSSKNSLTDPYTLYYENALMLLDEAGEWYFDSVTKKLYYMPYSWQNMDEVTVTYPIIDDYVQSGDGGLVTITGTSAVDKVQNIKFEGITFADTTWTRPNTTNGHSETQNNHIREASTRNEDRLADAAVTVKLASAVHFMDCSFTRLGITGLKMVDGVENSRIEGNHFYDISGGAINIGDPDFRNPEICNPSETDMIMKNFEVSNNYIHDIGVEYRSAAAISFGYVTNVNSIHNEIFNVPYSGYHIGYGWDDVFDNVLKNVTIAENFIHDYMGAGIHDGGGIYTLGNSAGNNVVCNNYIRNQKNGNSALYPDNGTSLWTWEKNVVDLTETPIWPYSGEGGWYLLINSGDHDLTVRNNYSTTTSWHQANGMDFEELNITLENTMIYEDANWPEEAQQIIQKSGMEAAYSGIRNDQAERIVTELPKEGEILNLKAGEVFDINLRATDGKDRAVSVNECIIAYEIEDKDVAEVSAEGKIKAKAKGETTLRIYVVSNHIVKTIERTIYVGDELERIYIKNAAADELSLSMSRSTQISVYGVTEKGREMKLSNVTYQLSDLGIIEVSEQGEITPLAVGTTTLKVSGTLEGVTKSKTYIVKVSKAAEFLEDNMSELYKASNASAWVGAAASSINVTDNIEINAALSNWTTYTGKKFLNELLSFQLSLDAKGTWPSIVLRAQDSEGYVAGGTTGYIICMGNAGVQVQRFNGTERTVFYGDVEGVPGIYGGNITNHGLEDKQLHDIQVGALTDGNSVRLYMSIDGIPLFDILDESENAILDAGYFGLVGRNGDAFRFVKTEENYSAGISTDRTKVTEGDVVYIPVRIHHSEDEKFNMAEMTLSYDAKVLKFNSEKSKLEDVNFREENGTLTLEIIGREKMCGDSVVVLAFEALKSTDHTSVVLQNANVVFAEDPTTAELKPATLQNAEVKLQIMKKIQNEDTDKLPGGEDGSSNPQKPVDSSHSSKGQDKEKTTENQTTSGVNAGDSAQILLWLGIALVMMFLMVFLKMKQRKVK